MGDDEQMARAEEHHLAQRDVEPARWGFVFRLLYGLNRLVCRVLYHLDLTKKLPLPETGPALLVCDHTSYNDAMVLLATAGRPVTFVVTRDVYDQPHLRWALRAAHCIPVRRGATDMAAARQMFKTLHSGEVLGIFPEGGIDEHRMETGHPGVGYLALKTGVPVIPASIVWQEPRPPTLLRTLFTPGHAIVRHGAPLSFRVNPDPTREEIRAATDAIMAAVQTSRGPV